MSNYKVVLFKNKTARKILNEFKTFKKAKLYYTNKLKESEETLFEVVVENGKSCKYEIAIIENSKSQLLPVYLTDEMGRNVKVKLEDSQQTIVEISTYKKPEKIFDIKNKTKIDIPYFIKKYLRGDGLKMVSGLNNKIIVQNDDNFELFSLKNIPETERFLNFLTEYFIKTNKKDCLIIKDSSKPQKKYLLDLLLKNGFDKKILYRQSTTYSSTD